jgi:hypothetical protein
MSSCPNKNTPEWSKLVDTVGNQMAYDIYITMGEQIPTLGIAPNGKDSKLYFDLRNNYTEELANKYWYLSKTGQFMFANNAVLDSNGELQLEDVVGSAIKDATYDSSIDSRVNNVVNAAYKFAQDSTIRFANRIKAYPTYGSLIDTTENLAKTGIMQDLGEIDLSNLAKALGYILKYNHTTLLAKPTEKTKGGILYRLEQYEKQSIDAILADPTERANFIHFMKHASTFIHGFMNVTDLVYSQEGDFTEAEKIINDVISQIKELDTHISNANAKFNTLLEEFYEKALAPITTNPEIQRGYRNIIQTGDDESAVQLMLDALADTNNAFVANMVKRYIFNITNANKNADTEVNTLYDLLREATGIVDVQNIPTTFFMKYIEHIDGKPTGRFVQKYDWDKFYAAKSEYFDNLRAKYPPSMRHSEEYINETLKWYEENEVATMTLEEMNNIIAKKKAELSSAAYEHWYKQNFRVSEYGTYVRIGGRLFKQPSDKYINSTWASVKDDKLFQYMSEITTKYGAKFGKDNMFLNGFTPVLKDKANKETAISELWSKLGAQRPTVEFLGEDNEMIRILTIPMMYKLGEQQDFIKISDRLPDESPLDYTKRVLTEVEEAGFGKFKSLNDIKKRNAEIYKENLIAHGNEVSYNLAAAFTRFIREANRTAAKLSMQSEYELALNQIRNIKFTKRSAANKVLTNSAGSKIANKRIFATETKVSSNLEQHYKEWLEAIFFENFDLDEGNLTKVSKLLLRYSSAKSMWLNVTAGINNVMFGKVQIAMEKQGGLFIDKASLHKADRLYINALSDYIANLNSEESDTLTGGLIKFFDVAQNTNEKDYATGFLHHKLISTDSMYVLNNLGEHYMQNTMLLAMLNSHRLVNNRLMALHDFKYDNYKEALYDILNAEESNGLDQYYKVRIENEGNLDSKKDYLYDFLLTLPEDKQLAFITKRKELDAISQSVFEKHTLAIDLFELKDNKVQVKENINVGENTIAEFRYRVLKVNQSLHGIYNTDDANLLSRRAVGKMVMQFRKWMRPGWNRRFGSKFWGSFWNEGRQSWDKGTYVSLMQFLNSSAKSSRHMDESEGQIAIKAITNIVKSISNFAKNVKLYYNLLDNYEKANVNRALTEVSYLLLTVIAGFILKGLTKGDDDEPYMLDMAIYQADRLMSELMVYTPFGLINETQKILQSPAAVVNALEDVSKFLLSAIAYPIQNEENRIYQTGVYAGEYKVKVNAVRAIPILNKIQSLKRIAKFNKYYILFRG